MKKGVIYVGAGRWFNLGHCLRALIPNGQSVLVSSDSGFNRNGATTLPALEDLISPTPRCPAPKKIGPRLTRDIRRDILLLRELNDYEDETEYTYERIAKLLSKRHG